MYIHLRIYVYTYINIYFDEFLSNTYYALGEISYKRKHPLDGEEASSSYESLKRLKDPTSDLTDPWSARR